MKTLIKLRDVQKATALSRSSIYCKMNPKDARYDPEFPRPVRIASNSVAWIEQEIQAWIDKRISASRKQHQQGAEA